MKESRLIMKYQILEHTADLKIKVWGKDLPELFKNAADAMFDAMTGSNQQPANSEQKAQNIKISGIDHESLLANFLNELLYLSDIKNKGFKILDLKIKNKEKLKLEAKLLPYPLPPLEIEIKGATYHNLKIEKKTGPYLTTILFDI
jgi:SHS2 domain-containing protein